MKGIYFTSKKGNNYFYDDITGLIHYIQNDGESFQEYENLSKDIRVSNAEISPSIHNIKKYIFNYANGFRQLLIETTSQCNLRCKYCVYSDHYKYTKGYADNYMKFNIVKLAIDYYFENLKEINYRNPTRIPIIGFYGGEPLLNFKLIKEVVEYIKCNYNDYDEIQYNITTNGILLKDDIIDFLVENNFAIIISLDGNKENHDRNRVKIDGTGSFDQVFSNIKALRCKYPDYLKMAISACYDIKTDLLKYMEFFDKEKMFVAKLSPIDSNNTTYYEKFTNEEKMDFVKTQNLLQNMFLDKVEKGCLSKKSFLYTMIGINYSEFAIHPVLNEVRPKFLPFTSCCVPGEKIYVTTDGKYHICEKVNSNFSIGDVEKGLNWGKISNMIYEYKKNICDTCYNCNVSRFCSLCFQHCCTDDKFIKPNSICAGLEGRIKNMLEKYINVLEVKPDIFDNITVDYYNKIYEMVGIVLE